MARHYLFADESGNLDFSRRDGASRYFAVGTLHIVGDETVDDLRRDLFRLRTELAWRHIHEAAEFGAAEDSQAVRDAVFRVLNRHQFALDVTLFEKSKAQPHLRATDDRFFAHVWSDHFRRLPGLFDEADDLMIIVSAVGTNRGRRVFRAALDDAVRQCAWKTAPRVLFTPAAADPALQAADYGLWAVARWWHRGDRRSLDLVLDRVRSQRDAFASGTTHYY